MRVLSVAILPLDCFYLNIKRSVEFFIFPTSDRGLLSYVEFAAILKDIINNKQQKAKIAISRTMSCPCIANSNVLEQKKCLCRSSSIGG